MPDATTIAERLLDRYPRPRLALDFSSPLELLVAVVLSAQCTDARVNAVTAELFKKYGNAVDYAHAELDTLETEIKPTGFYRNKAKAPIACGRTLVERFGGQVPSTVEALTTLPGVGRKTANMVLGNAFGQQAIAVDTHVLRVAGRIGLVHTTDAGKAEAELQQRIPSDWWTPFTNAVILHGRETCTARRPKCSTCVVEDLCTHPAKTSAAPAGPGRRRVPTRRASR